MAVSTFALTVSVADLVVTIDTDGCYFSPSCVRCHRMLWFPLDGTFASVLDSEKRATQFTIGRGGHTMHLRADGSTKGVCSGCSGEQPCQILKIVVHLVGSIASISPISVKQCC